MDLLTKTSIDLELDLAAQQSKLNVLEEEIERLRQIKKQMEEAKEKGDKELPIWLQEDEKFQYLLASVSFLRLVSDCFETSFTTSYICSARGEICTEKYGGETYGETFEENCKGNLQAEEKQKFERRT